MSDRRQATLADCQGCESNRFNVGDQRCWSFKHARVIQLFRRHIVTGRIELIDRAQCYSQPGYEHLRELPASWQSRSQLEGQR